MEIMESDQTEQMIKGEMPLRQVQKESFLIVVGRMGHGKSSFCKMIVDEEQRGKIWAHDDIQSGTWTCNKYRCGRFRDIFGEDIHVIDTPGIDSKTNISLIVEDIDDMILKHSAQVVGIAYVLDIKQRQQNQEGDSHIFNFLNLLRIKYCYKINLTFCILSKFDEYYRKKKSNKNLSQQFDQLFKKNQYGQMWKHRIQWMSEPVFDKEVFQEVKQQKQGQQIYENQFKQIDKFLENVKIKNYFLSHKSYLEDREEFEQILRNQLTLNYQKFLKKNKNDSFQLLIQAQTEKEKTFRGLLKFIVGYTGSLTSLIVGRTIAQVTTVGLLSAVALPIFAGIASVGLTGWGIYTMFTSGKSSIAKPMDEKAKQQALVQRLQLKLKACLMAATNKIVKLDRCIISIQDKPLYFTSIQCFDQKKKKIKMHTSQNGKNMKAKLRDGQNSIIFTYSLPSNQQYQAFFKQISSEFYNKKE